MIDVKAPEIPEAIRCREKPKSLFSILKATKISKNVNVLINVLKTNLVECFVVGKYLEVVAIETMADDIINKLNEAVRSSFLNFLALSCAEIFIMKYPIYTEKLDIKLEMISILL